MNTDSFYQALSTALRAVRSGCLPTQRAYLNIAEEYIQQAVNETSGKLYAHACAAYCHFRFKICVPEMRTSEKIQALWHFWTGFEHGANGHDLIRQEQDYYSIGYAYGRWGAQSDN